MISPNIKKAQNQFPYDTISDGYFYPYNNPFTKQRRILEPQADLADTVSEPKCLDLQSSTAVPLISY